jgi:hypothetical protein
VLAQVGDQTIVLATHEKCQFVDSGHFKVRFVPLWAIDSEWISQFADMPSLKSAIDARLDAQALWCGRHGSQATEHHSAPVRCDRYGAI